MKAFLKKNCQFLFVQQNRWQRQSDWSFAKPMIWQVREKSTEEQCVESVNWLFLILIQIRYRQSGQFWHIFSRFKQNQTKQRKLTDRFVVLCESFVNVCFLIVLLIVIVILYRFSIFFSVYMFAHMWSTLASNTHPTTIHTSTCLF